MENGVSLKTSTNSERAADICSFQQYYMSKSGLAYCKGWFFLSVSAFRFLNDFLFDIDAYTPPLQKPDTRLSACPVL